MLIERTESEVLSLAASAELSENSRPGFATKVNPQEPGLLSGNVQSTLGMHVSLRETRGGSRIQTWNRYAYVGNNPLNSIDPLGLFANVLPPAVGPSYWDFWGNAWSHWNRFEYQIEPPDRGGRPSGTKAPLSAKQQKRYNGQKSVAINGLMNPDCINFCLSIGVDPTLLQITILSQTAFSGPGSTITQQDAGTGIPNRGTSIIDPQKTVSNAFSTYPNVNAAASTTANEIYFSGLSAINAGTIQHEALHTLTGWGDTTLQGKMGLQIAPSNTSNITQALKDHHCSN